MWCNTSYSLKLYKEARLRELEVLQNFISYVNSSNTTMAHFVRDSERKLQIPIEYRVKDRKINEIFIYNIKERGHGGTMDSDSD